MSNGDSFDGFVFPPFIPTASTRPAQAPPAAPQPPAQSEPPAAPAAAEASGARMTMPWDVETPIVREAEAPAAQPAESAADDADDDGEDLPWLEVPTPRETAAEAPAAPQAPAAAGEAFPDWMAWDEAAERAAEAEMRDSVTPVAGLEDFAPMNDLGGFITPAPAVDWAEAEPPAAAQPAGFGAAGASFPEADFDALLAPSDADAGAPAEASTGADFDALLAPSDTGTDARTDATDAFLSPADARAPAAEDWSLDAPEAAPPPQVGDELAVEVTLDEAPAEVSPQPFVADDEAVMAAEPAPSTAAEPDPFTAAAVAEAESAAPAETRAEASPFRDVADRLEAIARMLRERPDELLAGGSNDPLALLVTGYVMGYTARGR